MLIRNQILLGLSALFCSIVVTGNLTFQKFVYINLPFYQFEVSVGVILYPVTFLIMDLITEFFGKQAASFVIRLGISINLTVIALLFFADNLTATSWSPVDDKTFSIVFGSYTIATVASLIANYLAQLIDVNIFLWLKKLTRGKHLWLRNNVSTIIGQLIDTLTVVSILCIFDILSVNVYWSVIISSFTFKVICALIDTPFCYLFSHLIQKQLNKSR